METISKCLFIPDSFGVFDIDYWKYLAPRTEFIQLSKMEKGDDEAHGDYMVQRALMRAKPVGGLDKVFVMDRREEDYFTIAKELGKQYYKVNVSHSYGIKIIRKGDSFQTLMSQMLQDSYKKNMKVTMFDGLRLDFFSAGNWGTANGLAWPQALWADHFEDVFMVAACEDDGTPVDWSSKRTEEDDGVISIATNGVNRPVRDPRNGKFTACSGTSPACAEAAADATARDIFEPDVVKQYWENELTIAKSWYPEWKAGKHHDGMGRGAILDRTA